LLNFSGIPARSQSHQHRIACENSDERSVRGGVTIAAR
jgi:hypothetical protein